MSNEVLPQTFVASLHLEELGNSAWVVDPPSVECAILLEEMASATLHFVCSSHERALALHEAGLTERTHFAVWPPGEQNNALVYLPKSRARLEATLDWCTRSVSPGGTVLLSGHKREGIKSAGKKLKERLGPATKQEFARHCSLWRATVERVAAPLPGLTYWSDPMLGSIEIASLPGAFSMGKMDAGTRLLLSCLPPLNGRVLDLACGAGPIGAWAHRNGAESLVCADDDALAIATCRATMQQNNIACDVRASNGFSGVEGRFSYIVCNPPFHDGVDTRYDIGETIARDAPQFLTQGGEFWLVANRFLRFDKWLAERFVEVSQHADDGRFRVYRAARPR
ncbi:MAG: 16S rRNA (guanine1207-N2)-methyltransferase [Bradymonadia bacterium]|jgi:16S rRNA (guanine1207-N2)-methyltransferase